MTDQATTCRKTAGRMIEAALALSVVLAAGAPAAAQQGVAEFYKGKTLRIIVGVGVGSGYDLNSRVLARPFPAHIPGTPPRIVRNQPGAGTPSLTTASSTKAHSA